MREQRLLERLAAYEGASARSQSTRVDTLMRSIIDHLGRILNTRRGSVPADPEYGVPDITNLAGALEGGSVRQLAHDLTRVVARYEPRLKAPMVTYLMDPEQALSLRFAIEGRISVESRDVPVRLATRVSPLGHVELFRE